MDKTCITCQWWDEFWGCENPNRTFPGAKAPGREENTMNKTCSTRRYWYEFWGVCCNGNAQDCADFVDGEHSCEQWEQKNEEAQP